MPYEAVSIISWAFGGPAYLSFRVVFFFKGCNSSSYSRYEFREFSHFLLETVKCAREKVSGAEILLIVVQVLLTHVVNVLEL